jgi:hypothetical protein
MFLHPAWTIRYPCPEFFNVAAYLTGCRREKRRSCNRTRMARSYRCPSCRSWLQTSAWPKQFDV